MNVKEFIKSLDGIYIDDYYLNGEWLDDEREYQLMGAQLYYKPEYDDFEYSVEVIFRPNSGEGWYSMPKKFNFMLTNRKSEFFSFEIFFSWLEGMFNNGKYYSAEYIQTKLLEIMEAGITNTTRECVDND